jgi:uncharacterized protein (TIGR02145 family)
MKKAILFLVLFLLMSNTIVSYSQVTDIDGNKYATTGFVQMIWMTENLKTTRLNDGTPIKMVKGEEEFAAMKEPAFSWYKNDPALGKKYGGLYNFYAVKTGKLCPKGWHVSNDDEWMILEGWALGMKEEDVLNVGDRGTDQGMKLRHPQAWKIEDYNVDPSGFNALPGGLRGDDGSFIEGNDGDRLTMNMGAYFWTSTEYEESKNNAWERQIRGEEKTILRIPCSFNRGQSVRCVKD